MRGLGLRRGIGCWFSSRRGRGTSGGEGCWQQFILKLTARAVITRTSMRQLGTVHVTRSGFYCCKRLEVSSHDGPSQRKPPAPAQPLSCEGSELIPSRAYRSTKRLRRSGVRRRRVSGKQRETKRTVKASAPLPFLCLPRRIECRAVTCNVADTSCVWRTGRRSGQRASWRVPGRRNGAFC